jgi:hypothetical protein
VLALAAASVLVERFGIGPPGSTSADRRPTGHPPAGRQRVVAHVPAEQLRRAVALVAGCGCVAVAEPVVTRQVVTYRGQRSESEAHGHRITVDVTTDEVQPVIDALLQVTTTPPLVAAVGDDRP